MPRPPAHRLDLPQPSRLLEPGERTRTYRRDTTTLLAEDDGASRITAEDFGVAVLDELEQPGADRHFTLAQTEQGRIPADVRLHDPDGEDGRS